jgi:hypothetical protein
MVVVAQHAERDQTDQTAQEQGIRPKTVDLSVGEAAVSKRSLHWLRHLRERYPLGHRLKSLARARQQRLSLPDAHRGMSQGDRRTDRARMSQPMAAHRPTPPAAAD